MGSARPIIRQAGEGERLWFAGGGLWTMKVSAEETDDAFFLIEDQMERGKVTPLHVHPSEDETIYVLSGELLVHVEGEEHRVGQGGLFVAPRGLPHAFMVISETARVLSFQTPGTGEAFYREVSDPAESEDDFTRPPDWPRLRQAAERSPSIEVLGGPPFRVPDETAGAKQ